MTGVFLLVEFDHDIRFRISLTFQPREDMVKVPDLADPSWDGRSFEKKQRGINLFSPEWEVLPWCAHFSFQTPHDL